MIYNREEFARRQKDLKERIDVLGNYYNKEVMDYLYSLVNLEETILKDIGFLDEFGSLDIIHDLMKYNVTGRVYNLIDKDDNLFQDRIRSNNSIDTPTIIYEKKGVLSFDVVNADFRRKPQTSIDLEQKPKLIVKEVSDKTLEDIEFLENSIERKNEYIDSLKHEKPSFEKSLISLLQLKDFKGNSGTEDRIRNEQEEIDKLKTKLYKIEKYGNIESLVCNDVCHLVVDDLGISSNEFTRSVNKSLIKKYKYIDIIKRLR